MNERAKIVERLQIVLSENMNLVIPSPETDLFDEGLLDSLAFVDLLMYLEQEFSVVVSVEELDFDRFRTVSNIARFVCEASGQTC